MVFIPTDSGEWVSEEFERLARVIKEYDPALELRWIPPAKRTSDDKKPYVVIDTRSDYIVCYATELDTPVDILSRLFNADNLKGNVLTKIESQEAAIRALELKARMDMYDELADKANFLKNSPLQTVKMDGKKFDHNRKRIE